MDPGEARPFLFWLVRLARPPPRTSARGECAGRALSGHWPVAAPTARWTSPAADDFLATFRSREASPASFLQSRTNALNHGCHPQFASFAPTRSAGRMLSRAPGLPRNRTFTTSKLRSVFTFRIVSPRGDLLAAVAAGHPLAGITGPAVWPATGSSRAGGGSWNVGHGPAAEAVAFLI